MLNRKTYWSHRKHRFSFGFFALCLITLLVSSAYGDDVEITFRVNMQRAFDHYSFTLEQPVIARCGYDSSATRMYDVPLTREGFTLVYKGSVHITPAEKGTLFYRYVTFFDEDETEEYYFDYNDKSPYLSPKSKRKVKLAGEPATTADVENSIVLSHRMPIFPNPNMLSQEMVVTWECDMRPAYHALAAGKEFVNVDGVFYIDPISDPASIDSLGVFINGTPTGKWRFWRRSDLLPFQLFDDGTGGDVTPRDSIYTARFWYPADNKDFLINHIFRMSINGGDNEGRTGASHMINLDDAESQVTVRFAWGEVDPVFYSEWDYDTNQMTAVQPLTSDIVPCQFHLYQNYPNPFNASTTIRFDLAEEAHVSLKIFNILGQEVKTLVNEELNSGHYMYYWKAPTHLPSGIYFCELKTRHSMELSKLVLLK